VLLGVKEEINILHKKNGGRITGWVSSFIKTTY